MVHEEGDFEGGKIIYTVAIRMRLYQLEAVLESTLPHDVILSLAASGS